MEIELSNGQLRLWQWDTGQKVKVPENVPTVHFKWGNDAVSFDVVDGWVEIPPELTQKAGYILLWTYREDHTLDAARIPVERRPKPADYIYTPTEVKTWESLDGRITALEAANAQSDWDQNDPEGKGFIRNRPFYAEEPPIITNLGNTYDVWDKICTQNGAFSNRDDVEKAALSFIIEGNLYKHIVPRFFFSAYVYNYVAGEYEVTVYENNSQIKCLAAGKEVTNWQIVSVSDKEKVHHLDSKYLDPGLLARIEKLENGGGVAGVSSVNGQTGAVEITAKGLGALTEDDLQSATDKVLAQAKASGEFDGAQGPKGDTGAQGPKGDPGATGPQGPAGAGLDVTGATVGQTVKISAVDVNGVPTAWVPVDMGSGEKWEKIVEIELTDAASLIKIDRDAEGNPFALKRVMIDCVVNIDETSMMTNVKVRLNGVTVCSNAQKNFANRAVGYVAFYAELIPGSGALVWQTMEENNYNWADRLQKMGYKYNSIWESNAITSITIVPDDGKKNFGIAGTKINVIGVRA